MAFVGQTPWHGLGNQLPQNQPIEVWARQEGNQHALDQIARQGYGNARFEVNSEEGLDLVEEFYTEEYKETNIEHVQAETTVGTEAKPKLSQSNEFVQDIQQGVQRSVRVINY